MQKQNEHTESMLQALRVRLEHLDKIQEKLVEIGRLRAEAQTVRPGQMVQGTEGTLRQYYAGKIQQLLEGFYGIADELWQESQKR